MFSLFLLQLTSPLPDRLAAYPTSAPGKGRGSSICGRRSCRAKLAEPIRYATSRRVALERFLTDGRSEIDSTSSSERSGVRGKCCSSIKTRPKGIEVEALGALRAFPHSGNGTLKLRWLREFLAMRAGTKISLSS